jgi:hypothetical protein
MVGREGEIWFESPLPPGWILQPPKTDTDIDGVVIISAIVQIRMAENL